ncbi:PREDICTED: basigin [Cyphomyrmex costatus]|uniref:basigin n=1 Tax=Cyphomyrmex costatus TaxID=456900 RepID=UPI000852267B|nr:PREDICTED: basigin [Cyphomyrmex costatus]
MERRAAFVLLGMLYLAVGTLVTVQAVQYKGPMIVREGQSWIIECSDLKNDELVRWTRNGQTLEPELSSGQLIVHSKTDTGSSKLSASQATESHEGDYKCTSGSQESFHLSLYFDIKIRVLTVRDIPLVLECANRSTSDKVSWLKEKTPIKLAFADNEDIIRIDNETGSLEILKDKEEAHGNYTCKAANSTTEYRVVPRPMAHLVESISVTEGESLFLVCGGKQSPGVKIYWTFGDQNYSSSDGRVKITKDPDRGIQGAVLTVENIEMNDRGNVICRMSYNWSDPVLEHSSEAKTFLRVKDKLAALWPFLGICVEVVVLCAIILVYEKKRNKAELEESDTDQSPDTKPTPNKESDVRQRK